MASAEFARLEWPLLDLLCQLDSGDRYHCIVESLESQHRPDSLLHSPMVLLHHMVQVLAGSNLDASRKFAVVLHLPHRTMRGRIGVQRDLRGHASVLHRAAQKRFGGVHVPAPAEKEIDCLTRFVDRTVQVHPLSADLYIGLVHPPRSAHGPGVAPPPLFEFWKVALHPSQDRCVVHGDPRPPGPTDSATAWTLSPLVDRVLNLAAFFQVASHHWHLPFKNRLVCWEPCFRRQ